MSQNLRSKDSSFYIEIIVITVLSLVVANLWIRLLTESLNKYFAHRLMIDFIVAILVTFLAVIVVTNLFGKDSSILSQNTETSITPIRFIYDRILKN